MTAARRRDEITERLRQRVLSGLYLGLLSPGDRLPSVRELGTEFGANPRVIMAAYQQLADELLVEVRSRSGFYVAPPVTLETPTPVRQAGWLADLLVEGLTRGVPAPFFPTYVQRALETLRIRAVVADRNQDQLWCMADELARDYGLEVVSIDLDELRPEDPLPPDLHRADLLVTSIFNTREVRRLAQRMHVPLFTVTLFNALFAEVGRLLERAPVYFVVSDPRLADKLRRVYALNPGASRLHTLVYGRDDLDAIPPAAPVYITRLARQRVQSPLLLARGLPDARVFSRDSAREILSFIVRANVSALAAQRPG